jgi:hypothetical protein
MWNNFVFINQFQINFEFFTSHSLKTISFPHLLRWVTLHLCKYYTITFPPEALGFFQVFRPPFWTAYQPSQFLHLHTSVLKLRQRVSLKRRYPPERLNSAKTQKTKIWIQHSIRAVYSVLCLS